MLLIETSGTIYMYIHTYMLVVVMVSSSLHVK